MQLNFIIVEKNGLFYKHRNGDPLEEATASEALMWAKIQELERMVAVSDEQAEMRYQDGVNDGKTRIRELEGVITKANEVISKIQKQMKTYSKECFNVEEL